MALKTFGALTFATLNFASAVLNSAPTDGSITFKPTTFGAESFGSQTLHGIRNRSHSAPPTPPVIPPVIGAGGNRIRFVGQKLPEVSDDIYLQRRRDDEDILFVLS